jgi:hypothetical protein
MALRKRAKKPAAGGGPPASDYRPYGAASIIVLIVLFAGGLLHWVLFFHYGDIAFSAYDWHKEYTYYSIIKNAIATGRMPYHVDIIFQGTRRFLALPETNLSPQILLLPFMSIGRFVLVNVLILYTAGFVGCLLIARRYGLSILAFTVFFLLFNFNGHLTSHMGVGHSMWSAYFLLPFLILLTMEIVEGKATRTTPIKLAFVLFFIVLQGGLHIYVWALAFLFLLMLFNPSQLRPLGLSMVFSVALSAFRLFPAAFALSGKAERFIWSYPTVRDMLDALITIRQQTPERLAPWGTAGWWEYDLYIGLTGLAFVLWFGVVSRFLKSTPAEHRYGAFDIPLLIMFVLSVSYFWAFISRIPLPILKSERVATRFIVLPLILLITLASVRFNDLLERIKQTVKLRIAAVVGIALVSLGFLDHSYLWSVARLERVFKGQGVVPSVPVIVTMRDVSYETILAVSAIVSAVGIAGLLYLAVRYRGRRPDQVSG